jgi:regulatory protein
MVGTITALESQQHNRERVNVYLDGEYAFGLAAIEAARLRRGQVLSDAEIVALKALDQRHHVFEQAVRFLRYRPRSRAEIEHYLRRKHVTEDVLCDVLNRLEQAGYLDDEAFAQYWVENRQRFRPRSQRALNYELHQKGVDRQVIASALSEQNDEAAAWQAIESRLPRWSTLSTDELRRKLVGFLSRRGFGYETINHTFRKVCQVLRIGD